MNVLDFGPLHNKKIVKLGQLLEQMYGLTIDWSSSILDLNNALDYYTHKRSSMLGEGLVTDYNSEYTKFVLITESISIYLIEIAPKRKKQSRRIK